MSNVTGEGVQEAFNSWMDESLNRLEPDSSDEEQEAVPVPTAAGTAATPLGPLALVFEGGP